MINTAAKGSNQSNEHEEDKTESFEVIGDSASSIAAGGGAQSSSSYSSALDRVIKGTKKGKSREEAFQNLAIDRAELLSTGEIRLPNGKIIGHRDYKHIYRQRTRLPDQREAIVINKLAIEYRRAQMAENGLVLANFNANRGDG